MSIDHKAILTQEVKETVRKRIGELTEELKTKFDVGFRQGVYILHTVDGSELPDGLWIVFPPEMPAELAYDFVGAGYETMKKFIDSGIGERLKILRKYNQDHPQAANGNSCTNGAQPSKEKDASDG